MQLRLSGALAALWIGFACPIAYGQDSGTTETVSQDGTEDVAKDETEVDAAAIEEDPAVAEISAAIRAYAEAYNARDAAKVAAHWSPDGVYVSKSSGEQVVGREAIAKELETTFAGDNPPTIELYTETIDFISPNVALETGYAIVRFSEDDAVESTYNVVYTKIAGEWLIDRVTEEEVVVEPSHYAYLQDLEWMIGSWIDEGDGFLVEFDCQWTTKQNFIARKYSVERDGEVDASGLQVIGWDPASEQIRSWLFDSEGSYVLGTWTQKEDRWIVQSVATFAGGGSGSSTSIFKPQEDGTYTWQKVNRVVDGELLPNIDEIVLRRQ